MCKKSRKLFLTNAFKTDMLAKTLIEKGNIFAHEKGAQHSANPDGSQPMQHQKRKQQREGKA